MYNFRGIPVLYMELICVIGTFQLVNSLKISFYLDSFQIEDLEQD
jgi:hypothetical protein